MLFKDEYAIIELRWHGFSAHSRAQWYLEMYRYNAHRYFFLLPFLPPQVDELQRLIASYRMLVGWYYFDRMRIGIEVNAFIKRVERMLLLFFSKLILLTWRNAKTVTSRIRQMIFITPHASFETHYLATKHTKIFPIARHAPPECFRLTGAWESHGSPITIYYLLLSFTRLRIAANNVRAARRYRYINFASIAAGLE